MSYKNRRKNKLKKPLQRRRKNLQAKAWKSVQF